MSQQEPLKERIREGLKHARIHLEGYPNTLGAHIAPIQRSLTMCGTAGIMPNRELKERAENILRHHGWIPAVLTQPDPDYLVSTPTGIQVKSYEGIMDMQFLTIWERILLTEFLERMELGEFPEIEATEQ